MELHLHLSILLYFLPGGWGKVFLPVCTVPIYDLLSQGVVQVMRLLGSFVHPRQDLPQDILHHEAIGLLEAGVCILPPKVPPPRQRLLSWFVLSRLSRYPGAS